MAGFWVAKFRPSRARWLPLAALLNSALGGCSRHPAGDAATNANPEGASATPVYAALPPMPPVPIVANALAAYNAGDAQKFFADFASSATPPPTEVTFHNLFEGYYKPEYGRYLSGQLNPRETSADPNYGMLVYDAKFERKPKAKVSVNFVREHGSDKIAQIRFEAVEDAK